MRCMYSNTVNVRKPNVRFSDSAEIRKIDRSGIYRSDFKCSNTSLFGFQTLYIRLGQLTEIRTFERQCSDYEQKFLSEIRTNLFGFQTLHLFEPI